jgi:hypothetical protein
MNSPFSVRINPMRTGIVIVTFACSLLGIASGVAQPKKTIYDQLLRPEGEGLYHVPIGLCEDYPEETTTPALIQGDMELLKRTGIHLLRISFGWDGIEIEKGKFQWGFWDDFVRTAVDDYGITLIPYICYTPRWNSTGDSTNYWNHTPLDYNEFGTFVEVLVNRYKDRIKTWELWNEPDIREFWSGNAADLARLTKVGVQAVRRADPTARIVLAGLAGHTDFTLSLFRDYDIGPYVDIVNCHSYFETWNSNPLEAVVPYVNTLADIISRYGNGQSLWMAEVGYSTYRKPDGYVSYQYQCTYDYEHTLEYQPIAMWRTLTLLLSTGKIAAIAWYEVKDLPAGEDVIGDVNNRNLGIDFVDHRPKPAESGLKLFNRFFALQNRCIDRETMVRRSLGSDSEVHCFEMSDGSLAAIAWLKTHIGGRIGKGPNGNIKDTRQETIDLTIPGKGITRGIRFDALGQENQFSDFKVVQGKVLVNGLHVKGGEIVILKFTR